MGDGYPLLLGHGRGETPGHLVDSGEFTGLGVLPLGRPAPDLPFDVTLAPGEVAETDRVDIGRVEIGQGIDQMQRRRAPDRGGHRVGPVRGVEHRAVDEGHDIERSPVHRLVIAEGQRSGDGHLGGTDGGDDAVLPRHVMRGGEDIPEWGTAQDDAMAGGIGDSIGQVGPTTLDQLEDDR